jgi:hypothetical protein
MRTMPAMTGKETSMQTYHDLIELLPIASAPVKPGDEYFGPCLLTPGVDDEWTIGRWCEDGWYDNDGLPLKPTHYALLPRVTVTADRDPFALARAEPNG